MNLINRLFPDADGDEPDLSRACGRRDTDRAEFNHTVISFRTAFPHALEPEQTVRYLAALPMKSGESLGPERLRSAIRFVAMLGSTSPLYLEGIINHWIRTDRFGD